MLGNINPSRIGLYFRTSSDRQDKTGTIRGQLFFAERWLFSQGIEMDDCRIYEDSGVSSSRKLISERHRDAGTKLLSDCANGLIDVVCVHDTARIGRVPRDFHAFEDSLKKHGVRIVVMSKNIDNTTDTGAFQMGLDVLFDRMENSKIKERMQRGREAKAALGSWFGGRVPYGYKIVETKIGKQTIKRLHAKEPEASHIRLIYELYIELKSTSAIVERLADLGIKSPTGLDHWDAAEISTRLRSTRHKGVLQFNLKSARDIIDGPCEALVTERVWDRAQRILDMNNRTPQGGKSPRMLSGLLWCGYCGVPYHGMMDSSPLKAGKKKYRRYRHGANMAECTLPRKPNIRTNILDELVWDVIIQWLCNPGDVIHQLEEELINESDGGLTRNLSRLESQLKEHEQRKDSLIGWLVSRLLTEDEARQRIQKERDKISEIEAEIDRVRTLLSDAAAARDHINNTEALLLMLHEEAEFAEAPTRREIVNTLVERVEVFYDTRGRQRGGDVSVKVEGYF